MEEEQVIRIFVHCVDPRLTGMDYGPVEEAMGAPIGTIFAPRPVGVSYAILMNPQGFVDEWTPVLGNGDVGSLEILLAGHTDCKAYGGAKGFASEQAEARCHRLELNCARNKLIDGYQSTFGIVPDIRTALIDVDTGLIYAVNADGDLDPMKPAKQLADIS